MHDFTRKFFVKCTQIYEVYLDGTLIKFVCIWQKISCKSRYKRDFREYILYYAVYHIFCYLSRTVGSCPRPESLTLAQVENGKIKLGNVIEKFLVNPNKQESAIQAFNQLNLSSFASPNGGFNWENISHDIGSADTRLMGYLQSLEEVPGVLNNASASTQGFSQYLIQTGQAYDLAALSATLFNSAINAGITLLVVLQVKLLSSVWDHFNVTVAETKEKIEGVNTRLSELNAEYETLNAIGKESLSKTEQDRLDYLDKRIDKEEELLELLEAKAIQEEIGGKFTDLFDEDSYTRKMFDEIFGKSNPLELIFGGGSDNLGTLKRNTDRSLSSYDKLNEDIKVFEKQMEDNSKGSSEYNHAAQQFEKTQDKLHNDVISDLQDEFLHWKEKKLEYEDAIAQLNKDLQNPNLPSKTRKNAEEKIKKYQSWLNGAETYIEKLSAILDSPQQLVESLASRLSNISSKDLRDNFSEDEISILANLKFSNDSTIEDLKALLKETQDTSDATKPVFDPVLFKETLNQENFSDTREDLLELAKTGKLTAESLEQTKGADTFLEEVSMSAEEAVEQLKNLLFTQEMLTDYNNVLDPLTSSYREFQELGYITQQTLEALPEMITSLESFDLFSQIAGDPDQSAEHIQEAFQKIIKQLLTSEDTVSSILNASRGEILVYIQNLRDMNIQNAEELVNGILTFPEHLKTLDEAEQEYLNYLNNKEGYDAKYIVSDTKHTVVNLSQSIDILSLYHKGGISNEYKVYR